MKKLLLGLVLLGSATSYAANSNDLNGKYRLVSASSEYAQNFKCSEEVEVTVNEEMIRLSGITNRQAYASFLTENEGCETVYSDENAGPERTVCTEITNSSAKNIDTYPLTAAGYVKETEKLELDKSGRKLIHSNTLINIPFGFLVPDDNTDFECIYEKL